MRLGARLVLAGGMMGLAAGALAAKGGGMSSGLSGDWVNPTGSVIRVYGCGSGSAVCAKIVKIEAGAPGTVDANNPDASLRRRSLCELEIGQGFQKGDDNHATGGTLYDPKSGKTYSGSMAVNGDELKLRGFIGVALFGRTETWKRTTGNAGGCKA